MIISHDQFFLDRIASKLFVLTGDGEVRGFQGTYNEYLDFRKEFAAMAKQASSTATTAAPQSRKVLTQASTDIIPVDNVSKSVNTVPTATTVKSESNKQQKQQQALSNDERKEYNRLEKQIEKLNDQIESFEKQMEQASLKNEGYSVLADLSKKIEMVRTKQLEKEVRWMQLAERG